MLVKGCEEAWKRYSTSKHPPSEYQILAAKILTVGCRVSLKSKLGVMDLHHLVCDVRRRVEHEVTFEGLERRIKYASTSHGDSLFSLSVI